MLMRTDPFRELDRLAQRVFGVNDTAALPAVMPMDAYREGEHFVCTSTSRAWTRPRST